jgi:hypothetical protein
MVAGVLVAALANVVGRRRVGHGEADVLHQIVSRFESDLLPAQHPELVLPASGLCRGFRLGPLPGEMLAAKRAQVYPDPVSQIASPLIAFGPFRYALIFP